LAVGVITDKTDVEQSIFALIKDLPDSAEVITNLATSANRSVDAFNAIISAVAIEKADLPALQQRLDRAVSDLYTVVSNLLSKRFERVVDKTALNSTLRFLELKKNKEFAAAIRYLAMTEVPENWIPFTPVHIKNNNRETQLQRASMLRIIAGDGETAVKIKPQTSILREGLEAEPEALPYYIHEEEVPRAGVRVFQSFQRTRWTNGEVFVWLGMKKKTGRGEGSSGLAFDQIPSTIATGDVKTK